MSKGKKSKKKQALDKQKNRVRGALAQSRSRAFRKEAFDTQGILERALADVLVSARATVAGAETESFVKWVEALKNSQAPDANSSRFDSGLSSEALSQVPRNLPEEIRWAAARLEPQASRINQLLQLKSEMEVRALTGDTRRALGVLDEIDSSFGRAIWCANARIAITQTYEGLDAQKQIVATARKNEPNGLLPFLARFISIRNEPSTTLNSYQTDTYQRISKFKKMPSLRALLRLLLLWDKTLTQKGLSRALVLAQGLNVVDLYEIFLLVMQQAFACRSTPELRDSIVEALKKLSLVQDVRLAKFEILLKLTPREIPSVRKCKASHLILVGSFRAGIRAALSELKENPRAFRTALLTAAAIRPSAHQPPAGRGIWNSYIRSIAKLIQFDTDFSTHWLDIEKTLQNCSFSPSLQACFYALRAHISDDASVRSESETLAALNSPHLDAEESTLYSPQIVELVRTELTRTAPNSTVEKAFLPRNSKSQSNALLAEQFRIFVEAQAASDLSLEDELQNLDTRAAETGSRGLRVFVRRAYLGALVGAQAAPQIIATAAESHFELSIPTPLLPLKNEFVKLRWKQLRSLADQLSLPNVLHLAWQVTGDDRVASNLRYAYNDFLKAYGLKVAAELGTHRAKWPLRELVFFLRYVCIVEVMDMSAGIKSSREALEARRDVCSLLIQLDAVNRAAYEEETFRITRDLSVQDGMRVLDSSRVHVDTTAIAAWATRELGPNIARYQALVEAGTGVSDELDEVWRELSGKQVSAKKFLEIPVSDADLILVDLINGLKAKFLLDPNHGLDSYLSRRVRHHSMSGYLRGAVEAQSLITSRDHKTGRYLPNNFWSEKIPRISTSEEHELQFALSKFSDEFDRIVLALKTDTFRVKSEEYPKGIFSVPTPPQTFHLVRAVLQVDYSTSTLCAVCFSIFWATLNPALNQAQSILRNDALNQISASLHRLKAALRRIFSEPQRYADLTVAIQTVAEDLNRKVSNIADWFNRSEAVQAHQSFSLERAIDICVQSALHSLNPFSPKIEYKIESDKSISSVVLIQLAEIVLTMLGNVRQHARCGKEPRVKIDISSPAERKVLLRMESEASPIACDAEARARVDEIRREIADGTYIRRIRREDHSGLTKIASSALATANGELDFGFIDDNKFFVSVNFEFLDYVEFAVPVPGT
jgi:hypothetical protein